MNTTEGHSPPGPCQYFNFPECHLASLLWNVVSPVFIVVGVSGNLISFAVLSRKTMCNSTTSVYLRFLAVIDSLVLLIGNFRELIYYATNIDIRELNNFSCKLHYWLAFNTTALSGLMLSAVSIDRLISIKMPLKAKSTCTRKSAVVISLVITGAQFLITFHILVYLERIEIPVSTNVQNGTVFMDAHCFPTAPLYRLFWEKVWAILVFSMYSVLPIICIFTSNILLVKEVTSRKRPLNVTTQNLQVNQRKTFKSVTRMLIAISIFFTCISLTTSIFLAVESYIFNGKLARGVAKRRLAWAIVSLLLYSNNAVNFILYCVSGSQFRKELKRMCLEIKAAIGKRLTRRIAPVESS